VECAVALLNNVTTDGAQSLAMTGPQQSTIAQSPRAHRWPTSAWADAEHLIKWRAAVVTFEATHAPPSDHSQAPSHAGAALKSRPFCCPPTPVP
jgi:hypothetical protein